MMYPRLKLARNLLRDDGVGFVSIDGNEVAQLKLLLTEIFGSSNVFATIVWVSNLKGRQISDGGPAGTHEYILCFARNAEAVSQFRGSGSAFRKLMPDVYKGAGYELKHDATGPYVTKNELYNTNSKFNERTAPTMVFNIHYNPSNGGVKVTDVDDPSTFPGFIRTMPHENSRPGLNWHAWRWSRAKILAEHEELEFDTSKGQLRIRTKIRDVDGMTMKDVIMGPSTVTGQADLENLGLGRVFDTPKPVSLLETLVAVATESDDIILDFFAGSAASAEAVLRRNAADGGTRRFIMVQLDEPCAEGTVARDDGFATIADIGRERIRRVGRKITGKAALEALSVDLGFRALRVDTTCMIDVLRAPDEVAQAELDLYKNNVKADRTGEDLLLQVLLDWGLALTMPIRTETIDGREVFLVDQDALIACFADEIGHNVALEIADRKPLRAVFRDSGFATDADRINAEQIFAERSPKTDVKTI